VSEIFYGYPTRRLLDAKAAIDRSQDAGRP